jgi:hypothetical protein
MKAEEKLLNAGYEDVLIFENPSYDDALIGVTEDNRAVYEFDEMVEWLCKNEGFSFEEAVEFIDFNTIRSLSYFGSEAPIVMYRISE